MSQFTVIILKSSRCFQVHCFDTEVSEVFILTAVMVKTSRSILFTDLYCTHRNVSYV